MQIGMYSPRSDVLQQMQQTLAEFTETAYLSLNLRGYDTYAGLSFSLNSAPLDLLFYDTELSPDPIEDIRRITYTIPNCTLILLCDDSRYALMGYTVKATNYLLTPLSSDKLISTFAEFLRDRLQADTYYLPIRINSVWSRVNMRHITYLESAGHSIIFHLYDGRTFRTNAHYRDYEGLLDMNPDFFRCHKSYVVNLRYVTKWDVDALTLMDGNSVSVSRPYRQIVRSMYTCYVTRTEDTIPIT